MRETAARRLREDDYTQVSRPRHLGVAREVGPHPAADGMPPKYAENGRRTVTITGQPVPSRRRPAPDEMHLVSDHSTASPRRRPSPAQAQIQARPDRVALWAFLLGLFLVFMAAATASAATL